MDKKSSVVDRAVIRGAAEMVSRCICPHAGRRYTSIVRRQNCIRQAVLAVENEIRKDPELFARYIVSRMAWDVVRDVHGQKCEVYMA